MEERQPAADDRYCCAVWRGSGDAWAGRWPMIGRFAADASVSAFAFLRYRKWFGSFGEGERSIMASRMLVALSSAFFLLFPGSEMAMADNDRAIVREKLKHLQSATSLVLMFVPRGMTFIVRL